MYVSMSKYLCMYVSFCLSIYLFINLFMYISVFRSHLFVFFLCILIFCSLFLTPHYRRVSLRFAIFLSQHEVGFLAPQYRRMSLRFEIFLSQYRGFIHVFTSLIFQVKLRYESVTHVPLATTLQIDIYTLGILVMQVGLYIQSMYVCVHVCTYVCLYACTYVCMHVSMCMYTHINTITYTHSNTYTHRYPPTHTHTHTHTHIYKHAFLTLIHLLVFPECR